jgi:hypothetical protein
MSEPNDDINYEQALEKLNSLQSKLHKLRIELPSMLRILAHIDSRETTQQIFNKSVEGAKLFTDDLEDFLIGYKEATDVLEYGKRKVNNVPLPSQIVSGSNATATTATNNASNGNNNNSSSGSLAAQKSIQSIMQSGMSQDEPIILDDPSMSSFIQF